MRLSSPPSHSREKTATAMSGWPRPVEFATRAKTSAQPAQKKDPLIAETIMPFAMSRDPQYSSSNSASSSKIATNFSLHRSHELVDKEMYLYLHSNMRDISRNPLPNEFSLDLQTDIKNLKSVEVLQACVPLTEGNIPSNPDASTLHFSIAGGAELFEARVPPGVYTGEELASSLQRVMRAVSGVDTISVSFIATWDRLCITSTAASEVAIHFPFVSRTDAEAIAEGTKERLGDQEAILSRQHLTTRIGLSLHGFLAAIKRNSLDQGIILMRDDNVGQGTLYVDSRSVEACIDPVYYSAGALEGAALDPATQMLTIDRINLRTPRAVFFDIQELNNPDAAQLKSKGAPSDARGDVADMFGVFILPQLESGGGSSQTFDLSSNNFPVMQTYTKNKLRINSISIRVIKDDMSLYEMDSTDQWFAVLRITVQEPKIDAELPQ